MKTLVIAVMCGIIAVLGMVVIGGDFSGTVTEKNALQIRGGAETADARKSAEYCFNPTCYQLAANIYFDTSSMQKESACNTVANDDGWHCYVPPTAEQSCSNSACPTYSDSACTQSDQGTMSASTEVPVAVEYYQE